MVRVATIREKRLGVDRFDLKSIEKRLKRVKNRETSLSGFGSGEKMPRIRDVSPEKIGPRRVNHLRQARIVVTRDKRKIHPGSLFPGLHSCGPASYCLSEIVFVEMNCNYFGDEDSAEAFFQDLVEGGLIGRCLSIDDLTAIKTSIEINSIKGLGGKALVGLRSAKRMFGVLTVPVLFMALQLDGTTSVEIKVIRVGRWVVTQPIPVFRQK